VFGFVYGVSVIADAVQEMAAQVAPMASAARAFVRRKLLVVGRVAPATAAVPEQSGATAAQGVANS
jgi:hypothetical protein